MSFIQVLAQTLLLIFPSVENKSEEPVLAPIRSISFSPDGKLLAASSGTSSQGVITVWDLATRRPRWTSNSQVGIARVQFAPSGQSLAVASTRDEVRVFDVRDGKVQHTLGGNGNGLRALAFAPDSNFLAVAGTGPTVRIWNLTTGVLERTLENQKMAVTSLAFSPDGRVLGVSGSSGACIWNIATGQVEINLPDYVYHPVAIAFTSDKKRIIVGCSDAKIQIWNIDANCEEFKFNNRSGVTRMAYDHQNNAIVICGVRGEISLFDLSLRTPSESESKHINHLIAQLDDDRYSVREKADQDFRTLGLIAQSALADAEKTSPSTEVRIRCRQIRNKILSTPRILLEGDAERVLCVSCSPANGMFASGGNDGFVKLWDVKTGKELGRLVPTLP